MPTFAIRAIDKSRAVQLRSDTRPSHLQHLARHASCIVAAGAILDPERDLPIGSLVVVLMETAEEVEAFLHEDPYFKVGLFAEVDIRPMRMVYPAAADLSTARMR